MLPGSLFNWLIYRQSQWYSYRKHSWEKDCNMPIYVWNIVPILLHVRYFQEKINLHKTFIWKITRKTQFPFQPIFNNLKMAYFFLIFSILSISTSPRHPARHLWMSDLKRFQRQRAKEIPIIITPTIRDDGPIIIRWFCYTRESGLKSSSISDVLFHHLLHSK